MPSNDLQSRVKAIRWYHTIDLGGGVVHIAAVRRRELVAGILLTNAIGYDSWPIPSVKMMPTR